MALSEAIPIAVALSAAIPITAIFVKPIKPGGCATD
jgi:hypothetical protein